MALPVPRQGRRPPPGPASGPGSVGGGSGSGGSGHVVGPADQATIRRLNLALLLRNLVAGGPRSRARLAQDTGLNKATVSTLVAELMTRRLVTEGLPDRSGTGRPGRVLQLDTATVRLVGLKLNVDYLVGVVTDLTGRVLCRERVAAPLDSLGPAQGLRRVAELARSLLAGCGARPDQVEAVIVSVPGLVQSDADILSYAPNLHWAQVDIGNTLRGRLGWRRARFLVDNDANLAAIAEYAVGDSAGTGHLLFVVGEIGVGAGILVGGQVVRGRSGFAGEVGHMPLGSPAVECDCGRWGCWETAVGLRALLPAIDPGDTAGTASTGSPTMSADGPVMRRSTSAGWAADAGSRVAEIASRAAAGDPRTLAVLAEVGRGLGVGVSILANVLDPEVIVLGGHFAALRQFLEPAVRAQMSAQIVAARTTRLEFSRFGFDAPVIGAAHAGIALLLDDPIRVAPRDATAEPDRAVDAVG